LQDRDCNLVAPNGWDIITLKRPQYEVHHRLIFRLTQSLREPEAKSAAYRRFCSNSLDEFKGLASVRLKLLGDKPANRPVFEHIVSRRIAACFGFDEDAVVYQGLNRFWVAAISRDEEFTTTKTTAGS